MNQELNARMLKQKMHRKFQVELNLRNRVQSQSNVVTQFWNRNDRRHAPTLFCHYGFTDHSSRRTATYLRSSPAATYQPLRLSLQHAHQWLH